MTEDDVVARVERVEVERLGVWIRNGWVRPSRTSGGLRFSEIDVARVRLICHLEDDLSVGEEGLPLVLSLMDQVYGLRAKLRELGEAVEAQPDPVRGQIRRTLRDRASSEFDAAPEPNLR